MWFSFYLRSHGHYYFVTGRYRGTRQSAGTPRQWVSQNAQALKSKEITRAGHRIAR